jgi:hypothetical protein
VLPHNKTYRPSDVYLFAVALGLFLRKVDEVGAKRSGPGKFGNTAICRITHRRRHKSTGLFYTKTNTLELGADSLLCASQHNIF